MSRKSKLSYEEKISAVEDYKGGKGSYANISKKYGVSEVSLRDMVAVYDSQGEEGLHPKQYNKKLNCYHISRVDKHPKS